MGYGPTTVALGVTALLIWVEDALGRNRVLKNSTYTCASYVEIAAMVM
jgi:hypothetical protein